MRSLPSEILTPVFETCIATQHNTTANQMMIVAFAIWLFDYFSN